MKCLRQPKFLAGRTVRIANLWEVHLSSRYWQRIQTIALLRRRTYSTVTRFCVLRLARKCTLRWTKKLGQAFVASKRKHQLENAKHRHMLCLYGDDEKIIRLAAMELGVTVSAFVRLALELYLDLLAMEKHSNRGITDGDLTCEAIRLIQTIEIFAENGGPYPFARILSCQRFEPESYW